mgnify:CR=1 FL=1
MFKRGKTKICFLSNRDDQWKIGVVKGEAQNIARRFADAPANLMTPTIFSENAKKLFEGVKSVNVTVHDKKWIESQKMNTFLSVSKGSGEPPTFLEIKYTGKSAESSPIVLVGNY